GLEEGLVSAGQDLPGALVVGVDLEDGLEVACCLAGVAFVQLPRALLEQPALGRGAVPGPGAKGEAALAQLAKNLFAGPGVIDPVGGDVEEIVALEPGDEAPDPRLGHLGVELVLERLPDLRDAPG